MAFFHVFHIHWIYLEFSNNVDQGNAYFLQNCPTFTILRNSTNDGSCILLFLAIIIIIILQVGQLHDYFIKSSSFVMPDHLHFLLY